jgi:uncharacterized membrane protein YGL010W
MPPLNARLTGAPVEWGRMNDTDTWLERYGAHRSNLSSPGVYWLSTPLVVLGTIGLLWSLPVPDAFAEISPLLNWGSAFLMATTVYYFILSLALAIGLLPLVLAIAVFEMWLARSEFSLFRVSVGLFVAGLIGVWFGHRNKRSLLAVLEDLQTIMLGPVWLLSQLYRRLGIPY